MTGLLGLGGSIGGESLKKISKQITQKNLGDFVYQGNDYTTHAVLFRILSFSKDQEPLHDHFVKCH